VKASKGGRFVGFKKTVIPVKTARSDLRIVSRREPNHPVMGRLPMSLARALTEPPLPIQETVGVEEVERDGRKRRRAA
jgi:hypothetical protein